MAQPIPSVVNFFIANTNYGAIPLNAFLIASFYKFVDLPDYRALQGPLRELCHSAGIRGTILLAQEGINATIAGPPAAVNLVLDSLQRDPRFTCMDIKRACHHAIPFQRMKVRLKREIAALKSDGANPIEAAGAYIEPADWNALISQDDVTLIDARNSYEVAMGSFPNALNPNTEAFNELPRFFAEQLDPNQHRRLALFCTGGIRCEKATAFLLGRGYQEVYQLRGGILRYLETVPPAESLWQGECFVFDERVTVDHQLRKGRAVICDDCKSMVNDRGETCHKCGSANLL